MSTSKPNWFYDELKHAGVDYADPAQAAAYDARHQQFRDYEAQATAILDQLDLGAAHTVLDMGAGTGAFTFYAAPRCQTVYAVDVSPAMLARCQQKVQAAALTNVIFCQGGFLSYEHTADPVDAVVSIAALHHLPDFWKAVGLRNVYRMLKPGGKFYLFDVVFSSQMDGAADYAARFDRWVAGLGAQVGPAFAAEVETHIRDEYSTFDWIMEGLLRGAGFEIASTVYGANFGVTYVAVKP